MESQPLSTLEYLLSALAGTGPSGREDTHREGQRPACPASVPTRFVGMSFKAVTVPYGGGIAPAVLCGADVDAVHAATAGRGIS
jgi:hypothetical protein